MEDVKAIVTGPDCYLASHVIAANHTLVTP